jgi:hypothetical protein
MPAYLNDGRFPDDRQVEVRYPRARRGKSADRTEPAVR